MNDRFKNSFTQEIKYEHLDDRDDEAYDPCVCNVLCERNSNKKAEIDAHLFKTKRQSEDSHPDDSFVYFPRVHGILFLCKRTNKK